jgi:nucleotide-binding universal stress UspA family protein
MFNKILVCLDGSGVAEQVLPYAEEVAKRFGGKLILLQVISMPITISSPEAPGPIVGVFEQINREEAIARDYLEGLAKSLRAKGLDVESATLQGAAGESIVTYAGKNKIELVVLATHGRSGIKRLVFGSVADYLMKRLGLPMLIIKPQ